MTTKTATVPTATAPRLAFLAALREIAHAVPRNSPKPALDHVRIGWIPAGLEVAGTDLETAIRTRVEGSGAVGSWTQALCLPLRPLVNFLSAAEGETLEIVAGDCATVRTSDGEALELVSFPADEYPTLRDAPAETEVSAELPAAELLRCLEQVAHAMDKQAGRYAMHSTCVEFGPTGPRELEFAAMDGKRLAIATASPAGLERTGLPNLAALLPRESAEKFRKVLKSAPGGASARLSATDGYFTLEVGPTVATARVQDGEFPRYQAVVPKSPPHAVRLQVAELLRRLKLVASSTGVEARAVRVVLDEGGTLTLSGQSAGRGKSSATVRACERLRGTGEASFAVNPDYLADAVKASGAETVELAWTHLPFGTKEGLPIRLDAPGYVAVVMPITVDA